MRRGAEKTVRFLLGILFFAGLTAVMCACFFGGGMAAAVLLLVCYAASLVLMPALHEAGHLIFGAAAGFRLVEIRFSFVRIVRKGDGFSFEAVNPLLTDTAGCCRMYPTKTSDMDTRFLWFAAGGVLVQAAYLIVCLPLCFALGNAFLWATVGGSCVYCAYLLFLNLLPFSSAEGEHDGALLWGLLRRDPSSRTTVALLCLQGELCFGKTPGETDGALLSGLPQLPEDDPAFARLQYYRYLRFLDCGEKEQAVKSITRLEVCLDYIAQEDLLPVFAELTYTYAFLLADKPMAEQYHARMEREVNGGYAADGMRARAAYAFLCGDAARAESLKEAYRLAVAREPLEGIRRMEEKLFEEVYGA